MIWPLLIVGLNCAPKVFQGLSREGMMSLWFSGELQVMNSVDAIDFSILSLSHPISLIPDTICYKILKNIYFGCSGS